MNTNLINPAQSVQANPAAPAGSQRTASLTAGIALLLMSVLSAFGVFAAIQPLIVAGDAEKTVAAILGSEFLFRAGIACMIIVTILDIIVSAALFTLFESVNRGFATMAAWFRLAYTAVFLVAILQLPVALSLLDNPDLALNAIEAFYTIWYTGLILFGVHLLLVGYLAFRSAFMARVFGVLLVVAGIGYIADGLGVVLIPGFVTFLGGFLFVGEVAFIFWLLIKGRRLSVR